MADLEEEKTVETNPEDEDTAVDEESTDEAESTDEGESASQDAPEAKEEPAPAKKPQTKEENAAYARARREREAKEAMDKATAAAAKDERVKNIIEFVGTNPYTNKPIVDAAGAEQYLRMRQIDKDGGDPLQDYATYIDRENAKAEQERQAAEERNQKTRDDVAQFREKYPNINATELLHDKLFLGVCGNRVGDVPLTSLFEEYKSVYDSIVDSVKNSLAAQAAKKDSGVGALSKPNGAPEITKEQFRKMSYEQREELYNTNKELFKKLAQ